MKNYVVYFEIFGKKLKTTVRAESPEHAKQIIKDKIHFFKVKEETDPMVDHFKNIFGMFDK